MLIALWLVNAIFNCILFDINVTNEQRMLLFLYERYKKEVLLYVTKPQEKNEAIVFQ